MEEIRHVVQPWEEGWRLGRVIRSVMQISASQLKSARWNGRLFLDGAPARADDRVHAGQTVPLRRAADPPLYHPAPWAIALNIPYADASLLVVDKPAPMACQSSARQPDNTLENALCAWEGNPPDYVYRPVNRLDKGTSGLMVVARSAHVQQLLQRQLHTPQMVREYLAVTQGEPPAEEGLIDLPIAKAALRFPRRKAGSNPLPGAAPGRRPGTGASAAGDRAHPSNSRASGRPGMPGGGRFPLRGGVDRLAGTLRAALPPATFASPPNR